jgi:hypothetical protein
MKAVVTAAAALLLALPAAALALGEESFGNAPKLRQPDWAEGVLGVVNLPSRVYSVWVNGNESFYYQGGAGDLNDALRKYAAVKADQRRLVLLPGRGRTRSFHGKPVDFDWQLHVPSGIYRAVTKSKHAVLTAYVNAERPRGPLDRKQAQGWLAQLDDDSFEKRQAASRALERLGAAAKPLLREALKAKPSPEARRRAEALLARLKGLDADDLDIPDGVTVVTAGDLLEEHLKGLSEPDPTRCGLAMQGLSELAPYSDKVVPALIGMLKKDKNEYVRRVAAGCLGRVGEAARPALPALKEGLGDADKNVSAACQAAVQQVEKAKDEPGWADELKRRLAILKDLDELKKSRGK